MYILLLGKEIYIKFRKSDVHTIYASEIYNILKENITRSFLILTYTK